MVISHRSAKGELGNGIIIFIGMKYTLLVLFLKHAMHNVSNKRRIDDEETKFTSQISF